MRRTNMLAMVLLPAVLMVLVGGYFLTRATTAANAAPANCGTWKVVQSPNYGVGDVLQAVSASSENNVWAVGFHYSNMRGKTTLIEHWNGTRWKIIPSMDAGTGDNELEGVVALSNKNAWAVGYYLQTINGIFEAQTLIEHWDGKAWSIISSPNVANTEDGLSGITVVSKNDIWAVGSYTPVGSYTSQSLIEQWNGATWSIVPAANVGQTGNGLNSVAGISANDIWAVGYVGGNTLTEQWNGSSWNTVTSPSVGQISSLNSITVIPGTKHLWAVGYGNGIFNGDSKDNLTEEWNGTSWNVVASPNPQGYFADVLNGVVAISSTNAWAVGDNSGFHGMLLHWDGTAWTIAANPNIKQLTELNGAALVPGTAKVWSVGYRQGAGAPSTLTEFDC